MDEATPKCPRCKWHIATKRTFPHVDAVDYICNRCAYVWREHKKN